MTLLLSDEQFKYPNDVRHLVLPREAFGRPQECPSLRAFAKLKRCDGACNALPFIGLENIGKAARNTAPVPGVMFEVIQPDLEFSRTHAASPDCLLRVCEVNRVFLWRNSGGLWRRTIGKDLSARLADQRDCRLVPRSLGRRFLLRPFPTGFPAKESLFVLSMSMKTLSAAGTLRRSG
jgi:hypothetical protein